MSDIAPVADGSEENDKTVVPAEVEEGGEESAEDAEATATVSAENNGDEEETPAVNPEAASADETV